MVFTEWGALLHEGCHPEQIQFEYDVQKVAKKQWDIGLTTMTLDFQKQ